MVVCKYFEKYAFGIRAYLASLEMGGAPLYPDTHIYIYIYIFIYMYTKEERMIIHAKDAHLTLPTTEQP